MNCPRCGGGWLYFDRLAANEVCCLVCSYRENPRLMTDEELERDPRMPQSGRKRRRTSGYYIGKDYVAT